MLNMSPREPHVAPPPATRARAPLKMPARRIEEFDALRGIAIIWVICLHAYFGPWGTTPRAELLTMRLTQLVANSSVPIFLFMSGFLSARDHSPNFSTLLTARLRRLAIPLLFWMTVALLYQVWRTGALTGDLVQSFLLFDISGQYYYVVVLLFLTAALYPLRFVDDRDLKWYVVAAFALNVATILYYRDRPLDALGWTLAYRNPLMWVFSFTFGLWVARTQGHVRFSRRIIAAAAIGMVASTAVYVYLGERGPGYPESYFGVTVFLFAVFGFIVWPAAIRAVERNRGGHALLAPFRALAPLAFAIYLVHKPLFVGELSGRVTASGLLSGGGIGNDFLGLVGSIFVVGATASIITVIVVNRLFPRFSAVYLGVEQPRRPGSHERTEPQAGDRPAA
ncbi:MAG: acyltransferase [Dehalococcoidia bacterium]